MGLGGAPSPACGAGQACGAGVGCPSVCSSSAPCLAGFYCSGGACLPQKAVTLACTFDDECASFSCSDGVCCESNCKGQPCRACNLASGPGFCLPRPWGDPGACASASYACRADGTCASGPCADDRDCKAGSFCAGASGCVARLANGSACARDRQCSTGLCVDGVCCNAGCDGGCQACNLAGTAGTCTPIPARQDPAAECPAFLACTGASSCNPSCTTFAQCVLGYVCSGSTCVQGKALGEACAAATECASNQCVEGVCCDSACNGPCRSCRLPASLGTCTGFPMNSDLDGGCAGGQTCTGGPVDAGLSVCHTSCSSPAQCKPGYACQVSGACLLLKPLGATAAAASECQSGFRADGVCCSSTCSGLCQACNFPGNLGACLPMTAGTDPRAQCDAGTCNGVGGCGTSCGLDWQCSPTAYCNLPAGYCAARKPNGQGCAIANECTSGNCVDGVCCNSTCAGACKACNVAGQLGTCTNFDAGTDPSAECLAGLACNGAGGCNSSCTTKAQCESVYYCDGGNCDPQKNPGASCALPEECLSGFCKDGVCCNAACDGGCVACNQAAQVGSCAPYAALTDPEGECGLAWCSGSPACYLPCSLDTQCKANNYCNLVPALHVCAPKKALGQGCALGNECLSTFCADNVCCDGACGGQCDACNASGNCLPVAPGAAGNPTCAPYQCPGASASCGVSCVGDGQCAAGAYCDATSHCVPFQGPGLPCTRPAMCASGFCQDSVCCGSACAGPCDRCDLPVGNCTNRLATDPGAPSCAPYLCPGTGAACRTGCTLDSHCVSTSWCNGTSCMPKRADGVACTTNNQCTNGNCVDLMCCNSTCVGGCNVCNLIGSEGTCTNLGPGSAGANPACAPYFCPGGGGACATTCVDDTGCVATSWCNGTNCIADRPTGGACTRAAQCQNGTCLGTNLCN
jgi:hypothetical protein